jgi:hypothetical protein
MTTRQVSLLVALGGSLLLFGCTSSDDKNPGTDSGTPGKSDANTTVKCFSIEDDLIAKFDTDSGIKQVDGRQGGFYLYDDGSLTGKFEPAKQDDYPIDPTTGNPECSKEGSFHTKATGFGVWGAALGTDFMPKTDTGKKGTYNASQYKGVSFWAKAATTLKSVQVSFPDVWTDGGADPSTVDPAVSSCVYSAMQPEFNCSPYLVKLDFDDFPNYLGKRIGTEWQRFDIMFADTLQDKYNLGYHRPNADRIDTEHLTAMAIQVNAIYENGQPKPNDFEIWVDDIYFIK